MITKEKKWKLILKKKIYWYYLLAKTNFWFMQSDNWCEDQFNNYYDSDSMIKGLSIESLLWGSGDGALKVFGDNLLGPSRSQNRRWEDIQ